MFKADKSYKNDLYHCYFWMLMEVPFRICLKIILTDIIIISGDIWPITSEHYTYTFQMNGKKRLLFKNRWNIK